MSDFDRRVEAWLRNRQPDANPDPGSVSIVNDARAGGDGGLDADVDAEWTEGGFSRWVTVIHRAQGADLTPLIREIAETEP